MLHTLKRQFGHRSPRLKNNPSSVWHRAHILERSSPARSTLFIRIAWISDLSWLFTAKKISIHKFICEMCVYNMDLTSKLTAMHHFLFEMLISLDGKRKVTNRMQHNLFLVYCHFLWLLKPFRVFYLINIITHFFQTRMDDSQPRSSQIHESCLNEFSKNCILKSLSVQWAYIT